ncbi:heme-binding protein [Sorangium sp. So ce131]|uniref:heme-binding protein n=1 Tax=Sorangium sp. So ce131 TaxID=3133282 RepID=UPI003F60F6F6
MSTYTPPLPPVRASSALEETANELNPLADLLGTWMGKGLSVIAVPRAGGKDREFILKVNPFIETLTFSPIGAQVPNRGEIADEFIFGVEYHQRIADDKTNEALHIETGMFLLLPATSGSKRIVRQASIPHGNVILAMGSFFNEQSSPTRPNVAPPVMDEDIRFSTVPDAGKDTPLGYANPFLERIGGSEIAQPNTFLANVLREQTVVDLTTLITDTDGGDGDVVNIPFIRKNANVSFFKSIFWIETVKLQDSTFQQLQYSQKIDLEFFKKFGEPGLITWPHVTVASLTKQ